MDMDPYEAFPYVHIHIGAYGYGRMDRIAASTIVFEKPRFLIVEVCEIEGTLL
jgi:hypothetical protein